MSGVWPSPCQSFFVQTDNAKVFVYMHVCVCAWYVCVCTHTQEPKDNLKCNFSNAIQLVS